MGLGIANAVGGAIEAVTGSPESAIAKVAIDTIADVARDALKPPSAQEIDRNRQEEARKDQEAKEQAERKERDALELVQRAQEQFKATHSLSATSDIAEAQSALELAREAAEASKDTYVDDLEVAAARHNIDVQVTGLEGYQPLFKHPEMQMVLAQDGAEAPKVDAETGRASADVQILWRDGNTSRISGMPFVKQEAAEQQEILRLKDRLEARNEQTGQALAA
ncbi:MAG: hypothetical protein K1X79_01005 [Oligoflexia bacterium]|nr:hypothetical protein [Oligoflexia bacterium]